MNEVELLCACQRWHSD